MNEEYIDNVKHLIEQKEEDKVKELLIDLHPADIAELCNDLNPEEAKAVYRLLDKLPLIRNISNRIAILQGTGEEEQPECGGAKA